MLNEKVIRAAAKELNDVLKLDPPFDAKSPLANLTQEIKETVDDPDLYKPGEFEFSTETQSVIDSLISNGKPKRTKKEEVLEDDDEEEATEKVVEKLHNRVEKSPVNAGKKPTRVVVDPDPDDEDEEKPEKEVKVKKEKKEKVERGPSAYGTSVEIMCKDPKTTKESLFKQLTKKGIDIEAGKSGILTGFSVVQKIVSLLKANGHMK